MKKMKIDLNQEIRDAIDRVWADCLERRKFWDRADTYHFSATEVARSVRDRARDEMGTMNVRIVGLDGLPLLEHVRRVLFAEVAAGRLTQTVGKGCRITGARFRPAGEPLSPAEKRAAAVPASEKRRRGNIVHWTGPEGERGERACGKSKPKKPWARRRRRSYPTTDVSRVTCKKCLKLIAKEES